MINQEEEFLGVDKNSGFALRVLILSVPAGLIFLILGLFDICLLYTSPSPRDRQKSRMPSSA